MFFPAPRLQARWPAILLLSAALAPAQPLSLDDCVRLAQAAQSAAGIAQQQAEIARRGLTIARSGFLPQAAVDGGYTYNSPPHSRFDEFAFIALNGRREYATLGSINLDLDTSGRLRAELARARADLDAATANVLLSRRDLRRAVAAAYYRTLLARHLIQVSRQSLDEAQAFERRTTLLFEGMEAARADVVKASAEVQFLQQTLNSAQLEASLANHDLASFWTADVEPELALADPLDAAPPQPAAAAPEPRPFLNRFEFRIFDAQRRGFLADSRRARAGLLPQLSLITQYGIDSNRCAWADRGYAAFVNLMVPVFDWFRARSLQRQFQIQARQVETQRNIAERTFSRDYRDALARVTAIFQQIGITESQVKLSEENLRLARVRYEGGEGSALDVVTAQTQLAQARSNFYIARANYLNARIELEVTAGR